MNKAKNHEFIAALRSCLADANTSSLRHTVMYEHARHTYLAMIPMDKYEDYSPTNVARIAWEAVAEFERVTNAVQYDCDKAAVASSDPSPGVFARDA